MLILVLGTKYSVREALKGTNFPGALSQKVM